MALAELASKRRSLVVAMVTETRANPSVQPRGGEARN